MHENPTADQEPKLPDQIADAWAAVLIDLYEKRTRQEAEEKPSNEKTEFQE